MMFRHQTSEPNAPSALLKQGGLGAILAGKAAGNHHSSLTSFSSFILGILGILGVPSPKFGKTEYSRGDLRQLGNLDEKRRR